MGSLIVLFFFVELLCALFAAGLELDTHEGERHTKGRVEHACAEVKTEQERDQEQEKVPDRRLK